MGLEVGGGRTHQQAETETQSPGRMQSHPWPQPTPDSRPQWRQRRRAGRCQRVARRNPGDGRTRETAQGPVGLPWPPPSRYLSLPGRCPGWSDLATVCLGLLLSPWTQASQRKDDSMSTSSRVLRSHRVTWTLLPAPLTPRPGEMATLHASRILGTTCLIWITYDTFPLWRPILGKTILGKPQAMCLSRKNPDVQKSLQKQVQP